MRLAQAGSYTAVLRAMASHQNDERLQTMACSAFWAPSSRCSAYAALLVQSKAHEAIINAMARHHGGSGLVQEHAASALANMVVFAPTAPTCEPSLTVSTSSTESSEACE